MTRVTRVSTAPRHRRQPDLVAWGTAVAPGEATSVPEPRERHRRLDAQRGVAVLAIIVFHVYQFCNVDHFLYRGTPAYTVVNSLDAAVFWLFVLLAFSVFHPVARAAVRGEEHLTARTMLGRTALRFLPVYYVAVVVVWLLRQPRLPGDWRDLLEHLTFTQVFDSRRIFYTIGPAWAVSVAVLACLLILVVIIGDTRMTQQRRPPRQRVIMLASCAAVLAGLSMAWKAYAFGVAHRPVEGSFTTWFGPLANLDAFAIGMALALILATADARRSERRRMTRDRLLLGLLGCTLLITAFVIRQAGGWAAVYFGTICSLSFACLVAAAVSRTPSVKRDPLGFAGRSAQWVGSNSWSIYLWHEALILLLAHTGLVQQAPDAFGRDLLIVVPASIGAGWLSALAIERPVVRLGRILRSQRSAEGIRNGEASARASS